MKMSMMMMMMVVIDNNHNKHNLNDNDDDLCLIEIGNYWQLTSGLMLILTSYNKHPTARAMLDMMIDNMMLHTMVLMMSTATFRNVWPCNTLKVRSLLHFTLSLL